METIILDSDILIEFYRQRGKSETALFKLSSNYQFQVSAITKYEIYRGDKKKDAFWDTFFYLFSCAHLTLRVLLSQLKFIKI